MQGSERMLWFTPHPSALCWAPIPDTAVPTPPHPAMQSSSIPLTTVQGGCCLQALSPSRGENSHPASAAGASS